MTTSHAGNLDRLVKLLALGCVAILASCGLNDGMLSATHVSEHKISKDDLLGRYIVQKVSWSAPDRQNLKKAILLLSKDGSYRLSGVNADTSSPLLPRFSGRWELIPYRGMDLGSRETWMIHFTSSKGKSTNAWCLDSESPYRLMIVDSSRFEIGEYLFLKRADDGAR
jgi:hypothetical protein